MAATSASCGLACPPTLTLKRECSSHDGASISRGQSDGFDKGRWPVRCPGDRAGLWPARISPMWAIARGFLVKSAAAPVSRIDCRPLGFLIFAPADRRWRRRSERQRELRRARRVRRVPAMDRQSPYLMAR